MRRVLHSTIYLLANPRHAQRQASRAALRAAGRSRALPHFRQTRTPSGLLLHPPFSRHVWSQPRPCHSLAGTAGTADFSSLIKIETCPCAVPPTAAGPNGPQPGYKKAARRPLELDWRCWSLTNRCRYGGRRWCELWLLRGSWQGSPGVALSRKSRSDGRIEPTCLPDE